MMAGWSKTRSCRLTMIVSPRAVPTTPDRGGSRQSHRSDLPSDLPPQCIQPASVVSASNSPPRSGRGVENHRDCNDNPTGPDRKAYRCLGDVEEGERLMIPSRNHPDPGDLPAGQRRFISHDALTCKHHDDTRPVWFQVDKSGGWNPYSNLVRSESTLVRRCIHIVRLTLRGRFPGSMFPSHRHGEDRLLGLGPDEILFGPDNPGHRRRRDRPSDRSRGWR